MIFYWFIIANLAYLNPLQASLSRRDNGANESLIGNRTNSLPSCIISNMAQNLSGTCQPISNCSANIGLLRAGILPTFCKSQGLGAVCCPVEKRISIKKCEEFSSVLTQPVKAKLALVYDGKTSVKDMDDKSIKCESFLVTFITGGRKAREREYPYQVALGFGDKAKPDWRCGGTLIDRQHVVTAGHCIITSYGPPKIILLGDRQLSKRKDSTRLLMNVSEIYLHHHYKPPLQYNDIAIIKLEKAVNLTRSILPACLPNPEDRLDRQLGMEATGWGQVGAMEGQSDILQSVTLAKFDRKECSSFFADNPAHKERKLPDGIIRSQFCAGDKQGFRDTCKGDSGGPLTVNKENDSCIHYIIGITSFGSNMCGYQQPGVYTKILSYLDWIENIVWGNNPGKSKSYTKILPENNGLLLVNPSVQSTSPPSTSNAALSTTKMPMSVSSTVSSSGTPVNAKDSHHSTSTTTSLPLPPPTTMSTTTTMDFQTLPTVISTFPSLSWNANPNLLNISGTVSELLKKFSIG